MFDPRRYQDACAQLGLGRDKLEEMIAMTEKQPRRRLAHPVRTALIAAACLLALSLTAFAASPAGQEMIHTLYVTYRVVSLDPDAPQPTTGTVTVTIDPVTGDAAGQDSYIVWHEIGEGDEAVPTTVPGQTGILEFDSDNATAVIQGQEGTRVELVPAQTGTFRYQAAE